MSDELIVRIADDIDWEAFIEDCWTQHLPLELVEKIIDKIIAETQDPIDAMRALMEQAP